MITISESTIFDVAWQMDSFQHTRTMLEICTSPCSFVVAWQLMDVQHLRGTVLISITTLPCSFVLAWQLMDAQHLERNSFDI
jgi:hypothetical protein